MIFLCFCDFEPWGPRRTTWDGSGRPLSVGTRNHPKRPVQLLDSLFIFGSPNNINRFRFAGTSRRATSAAFFCKNASGASAISRFLNSRRYGLAMSYGKVLVPLRARSGKHAGEASENGQSSMLKKDLVSTHLILHGPDRRFPPT